MSGLIEGVKGEVSKLELHRNNYDNPSPHLVYIIYSTGADGTRVEKFGISSEKDTPGEETRRPQYQVNALNREQDTKDPRVFQWTEIDRTESRRAAAFEEMLLVSGYYSQTGYPPNSQLRPKPQVEIWNMYRDIISIFTNK
jgi:hypothetical protein